VFVELDHSPARLRQFGREWPRDPAGVIQDPDLTATNGPALFWRVRRSGQWEAL